MLSVSVNPQSSSIFFTLASGRGVILSIMLHGKETFAGFSIYSKKPFSAFPDVYKRQMFMFSRDLFVLDFIKNRPQRQVHERLREDRFNPFTYLTGTFPLNWPVLGCTAPVLHCNPSSSDGSLLLQDVYKRQGNIHHTATGQDIF